VNDPTVSTNETHARNATYSVASSPPKATNMVCFSVMLSPDAAPVNVACCVLTYRNLWAGTTPRRCTTRIKEPEEHCRLENRGVAGLTRPGGYGCSRQAAPRCTGSPAGASYQCRGRVEVVVEHEL
jgi:hypothetical protein